MILGIGIDSVGVGRFKEWATIPIPQLKKVFSDEEITYCLKAPRLSAQRFAVRFAVREAFFKAFCAMQKTSCHPFLKVCKTVELVHMNSTIPILKVNWKALAINEESDSSFIVHCSLTHTDDLATAFVIIEKR